MGGFFKVIVGSLDCKECFVALRVILFVVGLRLVVVDDRFKYVFDCGLLLGLSLIVFANGPQVIRVSVDFVLMIHIYITRLDALRRSQYTAIGSY